MKTTYNVIALLAFGFAAPAFASSLTTTDGMTYNDITSQRADPDGVLIEYSLPGGGIGLSKVKFARLSEEQQKQFGYDASKAAAFSAACAKAEEDAVQARIKWDEEARKHRDACDTQDLEREKLLTERLVAMAQLKMQNSDNEQGYSGSIGGGFYGPLQFGNGFGFGNGVAFGGFGNHFGEFGNAPLSPILHEKVARLNPVLRPMRSINKP